MILREGKKWYKSLFNCDNPGPDQRHCHNIFEGLKIGFDLLWESKIQKKCMMKIAAEKSLTFKNKKICEEEWQGD